MPVISECASPSNSRLSPENTTQKNKYNQASMQIGQVTLGQYNQQNHPVAKQLGACRKRSMYLHSRTLLKEFQANQQDLHQHPEKIDQTIEAGIQFYANSFATDATNNRATDIEDGL